MDQLYKNGQGILCSTECPCTANPSDWSSDVASTITYDALGANDLEDCPDDGISDYDEEHYLALMQAIEETFSCAGYCEVPNFYLFSDVAV